MSNDFDFCIVGGGVVGLAIARQLSRHGSVLLLERHAQLGSETSSRNSEVIHAGLYYPPGSLKETLCLQGKDALYAFCQQYDVPHQAIGKLIVAASADAPKLQQLLHKGQQLGIPLQRLDAQQLQQLEPQVRGAAALWSPTTGILDSHVYLHRLAAQAEQQGALLMCHTTAEAAQATEAGWQLQLQTGDGPFSIRAGTLINAAGLGAQALAARLQLPPQDIPPLHLCRGHYFSYSAKSPFRHLIYPLPEDNLAGLGIHATLDLGGQVRFGPDTQYLPDSSAGDYHVDAALAPRFAEAIRTYFPALRAAALLPDYAGIRPKLHARDAATADFQVLLRQEPAPVVHLFGIESPGLTASLALAHYVSAALRQSL